MYIYIYISVGQPVSRSTLGCNFKGVVRNFGILFFQFNGNRKFWQNPMIILKFSLYFSEYTRKKDKRQVKNNEDICPAKHCLCRHQRRISDVFDVVCHLGKTQRGIQTEGSWTCVMTDNPMSMTNFILFVVFPIKEITGQVDQCLMLVWRRRCVDRHWRH